jgi:hypothetical protein
LNWPTTIVQWEWALPELALLAFLIWDVRRTGRSIRADREKSERNAREKETGETRPPDT